MSEPISRKLQRLDDFLVSQAVADDAFMLSNLDGFLAGIALSPEPIEPSEWWPVIWGSEEPVFRDDKEAGAVVNLIMDHYADIERQLENRSYRPIFDLDIDDSMLWEIWIEGFAAAVRLREAAWWQSFVASGAKDVREAYAILDRLIELGEMSRQEYSGTDDEELGRFAPDVIAYHLEILRHGNHQVDVARPAHTVGRNDPCPCGSGKKYKKCCLNAANA